jgi:hypothetical protein
VTLKEVIEESNFQRLPFKRPSWHYCLWYEEMLGYYTDGYNGMNCSAITIDDAIAEDFELDYGVIDDG